MEWVKERIFECEIEENGRLIKRRMIFRHRDDGVMFYLPIAIGHPRFDTREYIVREFAKLACEVVDVAPCTERQFDETFMMNLDSCKGKERTDGKFYSFLTIDMQKLRKWEEREWMRTPIQRITEE